MQVVACRIEVVASCTLEPIITQVFLEVVEKESKPEVTTNQPLDTESS